MSGPRWVTMLAATVLLFAVGATVYFATMRFAAELTAQDPRYQFERWNGGKGQPNTDEVRAAIAQMRAALAYEPGNPNLHSDIGRLEYWRVRTGVLADPVSRAGREAALESFRQAALLRPTSGHTWANIALTRYMLGQVDLEFTLALEQTLRSAPWQPQLQLLGIQLGLATWQFVPLSTQMLLVEAVRKQAEWKMADQKPALIRLLRAYGRMDLGCPWAGKALACPGT